MNSLNIKNGSEIGLSFDLGPVINSSFGSADKLCGVIPFVLRHGEYVQPTLLEDTERFNEFVKQKANEYKDIFVNDLDEKIQEKISSFLNLAAHMYPGRNLDEDGMASYVAFAIIGFVTDDLLDSSDLLDSMDYREMAKQTKIFTDICGGANYTDIPCLADFLKPVMSMWSMYAELAKIEMPNVTERNSAVVCESKNTSSAMNLLRESQRSTRKGDFSENTKLVLGAYHNGGIGWVEWVAMHSNINVCDEVRKDMLFNQMRMAFGVASKTMNDVIGVGRDIRNHEENDNNILRDVRSGLTLQAAFDKHFKYLTDANQDFKIISKILKDAYMEDQNVQKYIRLMEVGLDGQLHCYSQVKRYGNIAYKIINID